MAYLFLTIIVLCGLLFSRSKAVSLLQLAYIFIIIVFCIDAPDLSANRFMYDNISMGYFSKYEPIYVGLMTLSSSLNLSFISFRSLICIMALIFLCNGIRLYTSEINTVLSVLIIYPILAFASGLRSFLPYSISIYAFLRFLHKDGSQSVIEYYFWVIIATLCHYSFIMMVFLPVVKLRSYKIIIFLSLTVEIFVIILFRFGILYSIASKIIHHDKVLYWFLYSDYDHPSLLVDTIVVTMVLFDILLVLNNTRDPLNCRKTDDISLVVKRNVYLIKILLLPLLCITLTFERFLCVLFSVDTILFSKDYSDNALRKLIMPIIALIYNVAFYYVIHGNFYFSIIVNNSVIQ